MRISFFLLTFTTLLFVSCEQKAMFDHQEEIADSNWTYEDKKSFNVDISDTLSIYNMELIIDHSEDYANENVYMKIYTAFPTIETKEERITIDLANANGQWVGNCSGDNCRVKVYLLENFKFPEPGEYGFIFEQFTREENLSGINALRLKIYESKQNN